MSSHHGDCLDVLRTLPAGSVQCCALAHDRRFVGIELNPAYCALGAARMREAQRAGRQPELPRAVPDRAPDASLLGVEDRARVTAHSLPARAALPVLPAGCDRGPAVGAAIGAARRGVD